MFGTETSKFLKNFLFLNNLEIKDEKSQIKKILLSKHTSEFKEIAKNIFNGEIDL